MSQFYQNLAATAARLLRDKGQTATLSRTGSRVYDPSTGSASGGETIETGVGAVFNLTDLSKASTSRSQDGVGQAGSIKFLLGTTGISRAPDVGDTITCNDETGGPVVWSVLNCDTVAPSGVPVVYICRLER